MIPQQFFHNSFYISGPASRLRTRKRLRPRRNRSSNSLSPPQIILVTILTDQKKLLLDLNKIYVGITSTPEQINKQPIKSNEIPFSQFNSIDSNISVQNIVYLKIKTTHIHSGAQKEILLYDRQSGIDRITCSGNTKQNNLWTNISHYYVSSLQSNAPSINTKGININESDDEKQESIAATEIKNDTDEKQGTVELTIDLKPSSSTTDSKPQTKEITKDTLSILKRGFYKMYYATAYDDKGESKERLERLKQEYKTKKDTSYGHQSKSYQNSYGHQSHNYPNIPWTYNRGQHMGLNNYGHQSLPASSLPTRYNQLGNMYVYDYGVRNQMHSENPYDDKFSVENQIFIEHKMVIIDELMQNTMKHSVLYHHNDDYKFIDSDAWVEYNKYNKMKIEIAKENIMSAMNVLNKDENILNPLVLNFAAPMAVGKGFMNGSCGQEDELMRCTGLYNVLKKFEIQYHYFHKKYCRENFLYSHSVIYAPNVPVFRDNNYNLLKDVNRCSIISASAVNAKYYLKRYCGENMEYIQEAKKILYDTMNERIDKILDIAVKHKHDGIILGGFGCHSFDNEPNMIADIFASLLSTKYKLRFKLVRFSICQPGNNYKHKMIVNAFHYAMKRRFNL